MDRKTRTDMDTLAITADVLSGWKAPPFQRPLKVNEKVRALALRIAGDGGVIPGTLTLAKIGRDLWLIDGQHRVKAFGLSGVKEGMADVRTHHVASLADAGREFVALNTSLVRMVPDDILRGLEQSIPALSLLREQCAFVGYDNVRRGSTSPVVSMSGAIKAWVCAGPDCPPTAGITVPGRVQAGEFGAADASALAHALGLAFRAFGRDRASNRLWGVLNLTLVLWIYRHMVLSAWGQRGLRLDEETFLRGLMALAADRDHADWLVGRTLSERDRGPAYNRIRVMFQTRATLDGTKLMMPKVPWAAG